MKQPTSITFQELVDKVLCFTDLTESGKAEVKNMVVSDSLMESGGEVILQVGVVTRMRADDDSYELFRWKAKRDYDAILKYSNSDLHKFRSIDKSTTKTINKAFVGLYLNFLPKVVTPDFSELTGEIRGERLLVVRTLCRLSQWVEWSKPKFTKPAIVSARPTNRTQPSAVWSSAIRNLHPARRTVKPENAPTLQTVISENSEPIITRTKGGDNK